MTRGPLFIGLDIGTSAVKAGLVDAHGTILALTTAPCSVSRPQPGWAEQDPADYWTGAVTCIRELLATPGVVPSQIVALASCGHAPTLVLLDEHRRPVRPAIIWQDTRAAAEAAALAQDPGTDALAVHYGTRWPVDASQPPARFRWLARHEPETLRSVRTALLPKDYVHLQLTGEAATDAWSGKGLVHQETLQPVAALRDLCGVDPSVAPRALMPGGVVGHVNPDAARETGLAPGTAVVAGWTDAMAAMLGTGALGYPGMGCDVSGTSEVIGLTFAKKPSTTGPLMAAEVAGSGRYMVYGPTQASGASLGWALRTLGGATTPGGAPLSQEDALAEAGRAAPGAAGLLFLPYLQGERAPIWDPRARGGFFGLTAAHERGDLFRAVLEGVACSVRHVLGASEAIAGTEAGEVRVAGGGARITLWNQTKADVLNRPLRPCATAENGVIGTAMLAALGAGIYPDVATAGDAMVALQEPVLPDPAHRETYETLFRRYIALYPRIADVVA
jgi:xylulokinase